MEKDKATGPLGQNSEYPEQYDPSVLHPIPRKFGRNEIGIDDSALPFYGEDRWNAYEVSWLNSRGKPIVAMLDLRVPATSINIVESKSLKLYLGSFNQSQFYSPNQVAERILLDVGKVVGEDVSIQLSSLDNSPHFAIQSLPGRCIDEQNIEMDGYEVNPTLLKRDTLQPVVTETLYSHLLRSCCPVTGQPDWASVVVSYTGPKIREDNLLRYIVSYRNNQEFHEQCVERIYMDLLQHCQPESLTVYARYSRRGGIDINPMRSSKPVTIENERTIRQ